MSKSTIDPEFLCKDTIERMRRQLAEALGFTPEDSSYFATYEFLIEKLNQRTEALCIIRKAATWY